MNHIHESLQEYNQKFQQFKTSIRFVKKSSDEYYDSINKCNENMIEFENNKNEWNEQELLYKVETMVDQLEDVKNRNELNVQILTDIVQKIYEFQQDVQNLMNLFIRDKSNYEMNLKQMEIVIYNVNKKNRNEHSKTMQHKKKHSKDYHQKLKEIEYIKKDEKVKEIENEEVKETKENENESENQQEDNQRDEDDNEENIQQENDNDKDEIKYTNENDQREEKDVVSEFIQFHPRLYSVLQKIKKQSYLNPEQTKQIEEWTGLKCDEILFDAEKDKWSYNCSHLNDTIVGRSKLVFVIEDAEGELFGYYLNTKVKQKYASLFSSHQKTDYKSFHFNLNSNGRYDKPMKFELIDPKYGGIGLYKGSAVSLIEIGDIMLFKEYRKEHSYCCQHEWKFYYHGIPHALCGKIPQGSFNQMFFTPKKLSVIQMK